MAWIPSLPFEEREAFRDKVANSDLTKKEVVDALIMSVDEKFREDCAFLIECEVGRKAFNAEVSAGICAGVRAEAKTRVRDMGPTTREHDGWNEK